MNTRSSHSTRDAIIISDIHLAAMRDHGLFRADAELGSFLDWVRRETRHSTLFLNGDILDFLADETPATSISPFNPIDAPRRARAIIEHHPEVFDRLAALAQSPEHELVVLGGNHDPEMAFPAVKQAIEERLGANTAGTTIQWFVHGEAAALSIGAAQVMVEHGDAIDPWNRIDHQSLLEAVNHATRGIVDKHNYNPPPGSHFVVNHLNAILRRYPWADKLKPELEAVFPILYDFLDFEPKAQLLSDIGFWRNIVERGTRSYYQSYFDQASKYRAGEPRASEHNDTRRDFTRWFEDVQQPPRRSRNLKAQRNKLIKRLRKAAMKESFFSPDAPESFNRDLQFLLRQGADVIVQGHTHAAKAYPLDRGLYLNSGTWGQLLKLPESVAEDGIWQKFVDGLQQSHDMEYSRPTIVRVTETPSAQRTAAALLEWHENAPVVLAQFAFEPAGRVWEREN